MNTLLTLFVIADRGLFATDARWLNAMVRIAERAVGYSNVRLQIRSKQGTREERLLRLQQAHDVLKNAPFPVVLNGTTEEALSTGFHGVHWPEELIPKQRPQELPHDFITGASVHSVGALRRAENAGAHYALFGPVYKPGSKPGAARGLPALADLVANARAPILAVGGITPERVASCRLAGAAGVGVVTGIFLQPDPVHALETYAAACTQTEVLLHHQHIL